MTGKGRPIVAALSCAPALLAIVGCSSWNPVRGPADLGAFGGPIPPGQAVPGMDAGVERALARKPMARMPASIGVARIESWNRNSYWRDVGEGVRLWRVVDPEPRGIEEHRERLAGLPGVRSLTMIPVTGDGQAADAEMLRRCAAEQGCNMLLVYTTSADTSIDEGMLQPLGLLTLGLFPSRVASADGSAAAMLVDTRSGYVYASLRSRADANQPANGWTSRTAARQTSARAQRRAVDDLITQLESSWPRIREVLAHDEAGGASDEQPG